MIHDPDPTGFCRQQTADGIPSAAAQGRTRRDPLSPRPARPSPGLAFVRRVVSGLLITAAVLVVIGGFVGMAIATAHELGWWS